MELQPKHTPNSEDALFHLEADRLLDGDASRKQYQELLEQDPIVAREIDDQAFRFFPDDPIKRASLITAMVAAALVLARKNTAKTKR
jgi:hypothetical protein